MDIEPRLKSETGAARKIADLAEPVLENLGFRLVRLRITGEGGCTLQIMAERPDGTMTVRDCEVVSRNLSPIFDVEDILPGEYFLEVSSPGIDRPLVRPGDFVRWKDHEAKFELTQPLEGRKRYRGIVKGFQDGSVVLGLKDAQDEVCIELPFEYLATARLVLTDELIAAAMKTAKPGRIEWRKTHVTIRN